MPTPASTFVTTPFMSRTRPAARCARRPSPATRRAAPWRPPDAPGGRRRRRSRTPCRSRTRRRTPRPWPTFSRSARRSPASGDRRSSESSADSGFRTPTGALLRHDAARHRGVRRRVDERERHHLGEPLGDEQRARRAREPASRGRVGARLHGRARHGRRDGRVAAEPGDLLDEILLDLEIPAVARRRHDEHRAVARARRAERAEPPRALGLRRGHAEERRRPRRPEADRARLVGAPSARA